MLTVAIPAAMAWVVHVASGTQNELVGALGEECTAGAVNTWRRRRKGWLIVNGLRFGGHGDIDHVLIGPGGVYAIESKWTNVQWTISSGQLKGPFGNPISQAKRGAQKVRLAYAYTGNRVDVPATPVLVIWGPGTPEIPGGHTTIDGVLVCQGRKQRKWLRQMDGLTSLDPTSQQFIAEQLSRQLAKQLEPAPT
jgi:hypothetical protein